MPQLPRLPWTPMRIWSLIVASLLTLILAAFVAFGSYYTGRVEANIYLVILAKWAAVTWVAYIAAHVRDTSIAHQQVILARLHEMQTQFADQVADYGDRREIAGQMVAAKANGHSRRLTPID